MKRWTGILVSCVLVVGCSSRNTERSLPPDDAMAVIENRNWMDRWPTGEDDRLYVYRFTPDMGGGVYQDRTLFSGRFELFNYQLRPGRLVIRWPDRGTVEEVQYRVIKVSGPKPFDLKLELEGTAMGPKTFYGRRAETSSSSESFWLSSSH